VKNRTSRAKNEACFNFYEAPSVLSKRKVLARFSFPNRPWCTEKNGRILADTAVVIESDVG